MDRDQFVQQLRAEAEKGGMDIDRLAYIRHGKDPLDPIPFAGNPRAPLCILGRDLGASEVRYSQPMVGTGGKRVRRAIINHYVQATQLVTDPQLEAALPYAFFVNMVPYKPTDNKVFPLAIRERFREGVERLLLAHWQGKHIIAMGAEALQWFAPYAGTDRISGHWALPHRYRSSLTVQMATKVEGVEISREFTVHPLPHPSPLNATYFKLFPELMDAVLNEITASEIDAVK